MKIFENPINLSDYKKEKNIPEEEIFMNVVNELNKKNPKLAEALGSLSEDQKLSLSYALNKNGLEWSAFKVNDTFSELSDWIRSYNGADKTKAEKILISKLEE